MSHFFGQFNWLDWLFIAIVIVFGLWGLRQGFIRGLMALVFWGIGATLAYFFTSNVETYLAKWINDPAIRFWFAFIGIIFVVWLIGTFLAMIINAFAKNDEINFPDRILGMILGIAKGIFVLSIAIAVMNISNSVRDKDVWMTSALKPYLLDVSSWVQKVVPKDVEQMFENHSIQDNKVNKDATSVNKLEKP